jgi:hypothetical protein
MRSVHRHANRRRCRARRAIGAIALVMLAMIPVSNYAREHASSISPLILGIGRVRKSPQQDAPRRSSISRARSILEVLCDCAKCLSGALEAVEYDQSA